MIRILVVDDSPLMQKIFRDMLSQNPEFLVAACASSGEEALAFLEKERVDVITMDICMPGMDGFATTRKIMESPHPTPVVIISSQWNPKEVEKTFQAMDAGAVGILPKPHMELLESGEYWPQVFQTLKGASQGRVRRLRPRKGPLNLEETPKKTDSFGPSKIKILVAGASTGGPQALGEFLFHLPGNLPVPLLVVQHITRGFDQGLAEWLDTVTLLKVLLAKEGELPKKSTVYIAPSGVHMGVASGGALIFSRDPPEHGVRPATSWLFRSAAQVYRHKVGALLFSGMGKDGALELRQLRDLGALTLAQNRETSVVWGMPGEAVRLNAAEYVGSPASMAQTLTDFFNLNYPKEDDHE
jgi:two-component system chemotaxis response regulator CheB